MPNYKCPICKAYFASKSLMLEHQIEDHYKKERQEISENLPPVNPLAFMQQQLAALQLRQMIRDIRQDLQQQNQPQIAQPAEFEKMISTFKLLRSLKDELRQEVLAEIEASNPTDQDLALLKSVLTFMPANQLTGLANQSTQPASSASSPISRQIDPYAKPYIDPELDPETKQMIAEAERIEAELIAQEKQNAMAKSSNAPDPQKIKGSASGKRKTA